MILHTLATAAANAGFDVEAATRAYLDLLQGPARAKSDAYFEGGYWLILWNAVVSAVGYGLILVTGTSARLAGWASRVTRRRWLQPGLYALPLSLLAALIFLPWTIYEDYVREAQYGLMSQTFGAWSLDQAKALAIGLVANFLFFIAIFAVIRRFRRAWWAIGAGVTIAFLFLAVAIAPVFVAPLFNTYREMPAGPLRDRIVAVARANDIPAEHIYVSDASRQSKRISANVSGIGPTIRITLNDNLLARTGPDEVLAVMGHEMGHYVLGHIARTIAVLSVVALALFFLASRIVPGLIARHPRWGVRDVADPASAPLFLALMSVAMVPLAPILNTLVRTNESEADAFGLDKAREPDGFAKVAMRLSEYRKIEPGPVEEFLFFDHPSGATRVRMAMQWKKDHVPGARVQRPTITFD
jgi:STE24 endopeptidase